MGKQIDTELCKAATTPDARDRLADMLHLRSHKPHRTEIQFTLRNLSWF